MRDMMARTDNRYGLTGSLLLHLLAMALWLLWSAAHPAQTRPPLKAMLVDLVSMPISVGASAGAPAAAPPRAATAVKITGVKPQAQTPPVDPMEAQLAALANRSISPSFAAPGNGTGNGAGSGGGYALADYVRAQILRRWWPSLSADAQTGAPVALRLTMSRDGVISDVRIMDQARFDNDPLFRSLALSARNAAQLASPIQLPPGNYQATTEIAITLDPRAVLR